jgi:hypothetical protein
MLAIPGFSTRWCDSVSRRDFLQVGGLGAAGLALPALFQARAQAARPATAPRRLGQAKSCILLFMGGGPPQMDTFDLKPDAPAEIRGELKPIATSVPGMQISEQLPLLAQQMRHCALIRSVSDEYAGGAHGQSVYLALTGNKTPRVQGDDVRPSLNDLPNMGSALAWQRGGSHPLPPFVLLLDMHRRSFAGEGGGMLGPAYDPFRILQDPSRRDFRVQALAPPQEVSLERFATRRGLLEQIRRHTDAAMGQRIVDAHQERAINMIMSPQTQRAFNLNAEPDAVRDAYGRTKFGQGTLLARRLIEHGVPLVTVYWNGEEVPGGWDLHYRNYQYLKVLAPQLDRSFSFLLHDLAVRGLLDETLVVWMGEFGRAPLIESMGGRGHWARCYSAVLAGAGIKPGIVHGRSDRHAAYPLEGAVTPQDLVATIYHCLGISAHTEVIDPLGRPVKLFQGQPIEGVLA